MTTIDTKELLATLAANLIRAGSRHAAIVLTREDTHNLPHLKALVIRFEYVEDKPVTKTNLDDLTSDRSSDA
jgi:hypothetical protein